MIIILLIQDVLFLSTIIFGGTIQSLEKNAFDIFNERVSARKNYLQSEMIHRWSNIGATQEKINLRIQHSLRQFAGTHFG